MRTQLLSFFRFQAVLWSFLLVSCAGLPVRAQGGEPQFTVTTKNSDDHVNIQHQNGVAFVDILSPTGIGAAAFELKSGVMPGKIVLRLHLQGLEEFRLTSSDESVEASVSSGDAPSIQQRIISAGSETPILPVHPFWMIIDVVAEQAEPAIPLEAGYFEITLPQEFLEKAGDSFEIEWIDFYR